MEGAKEVDVYKRQALYCEAFYRKMRILLVETSCPTINRTTETAWIMDKDDCEIDPDAL